MSAPFNIRSAFFGALHLSGLPFLLRHTVQRNRVTILMFHDPTAESAKRQLRALARRYNIISLDQCLEALKGGFDQLPSRPLVVTYDDGFSRNHELLDLFKSLGIRPTIFVCSGIVGTRRRFWFTVPMDGAAKQRLKSLTDEERLRELEKLGYRDSAELPQAQALSAEEISQMEGVVEFGSHTISHPVLPRCTEEKAWKEIADSKRSLEQQFGFGVSSFAYPNGDATERDEQFVKKAGYRCALTTKEGLVDRSSDPYRLPRLAVNDNGSVSEAIVSASGLWAVLRPILKTVASVARRS